MVSEVSGMLGHPAGVGELLGGVGKPPHIRTVTPFLEIPDRQPRQEDTPREPSLHLGPEPS